MTTNDARDAAIREAKRYIRDIVRNDWCFEPSITSATGRPRFETSWPVDEQEVAEWRLRDYDDSCSELEPQADEGEDEDEDEDEDEQAVFGSGGESEGRRKRRQQMEEEMGWNEGLRTWMERRDAWSGARTRREIRARQDARSPGAPDGAAEVAPAGSGAGTGAEAEAVMKEATQAPITDSSKVEPSDLAAKTESFLSISGKDGKTDQGAQTDQEDDEELPAPGERVHHHEPEEISPEVPDEPYIPVVPSIISNTNPIRASITSSMYPSIYSKVIVQSLTPTVPINLADVTKSMVQGWKADGQWPAPPKHTSIVLQDDATVRRKDNNDGKSTAGSAETKKKSGVASAVRKVLHFSGFHPHHHPFHRRGSSSQHHADGEAGPSNQQ